MSGSADPSPYDEAYDDRGEPRPHYAELLASLDEPGALSEEVTRRLEARGVTFGEEPAAVDPVPRILTEAEWPELQAGIDQRLRALDALVADVYGDGRVFEAGVLDRAEVESSPHWEPMMRGASPRRWMSFAGLDVIRCEDGRFLFERLGLVNSFRLPLRNAHFSFGARGRTISDQSCPGFSIRVRAVRRPESSWSLPGQGQCAGGWA